MAFGMKSAPAAAPAKKAFGKAAPAPAKAAPPAKSGFGSKAAPAKAPAKSGFGSTKSRIPSDDDDEDMDEGGEMVAAGWGGAEKLQNSVTPWAQNLKMAEETIVMKFLDDEPYASVATHWLKKKGKRTYICLGKGCPLCEIGDSPKVTHCFNIVKLTDGAPLAFTWDRGKRDLKNIEAKAKGAKTGPLSKMWYELERTGTGLNDTKYTLKEIRRGAADIAEFYPELYVPTAAELAAVKRTTVADVLKQKTPRAELEEIAAERMGSDYEAEEGE